MNVEWVRNYCLGLPGTDEDVKWGNDLCFTLAEKMFCVTDLEGGFRVSFKVTNEEFDSITQLPGIEPAPYVARYKWVLISDPDRFSEAEWKRLIDQAYGFVKNKLSKKKQAELGLDP